MIAQKNIIPKIFFLVVLFALQTMFASIATLPIELFGEHILKNCFNNQRSINCLKKNYYNFCLLSKKYCKKTKKFWNKKWKSIIEQVCDEQRFERLYFAGIFYHVNDDIKAYFEKHLFIYKTLLYQSANDNFVSPPKLEWFQTLDPNFTMFGPNCQMSLLECCIKASYYPIRNKTELCIDLVDRGADYDIWMHHGLEENSTDTSDTVFIEINGLKKPSTIYSPPLLSEYIAWHKRCNVELAKAIVKKGTCAQDIFIKRYPELAQYRKEEIPKPKQPNNFLNNHHFSELRYLQLFFKGLLIPYFINETISMFQKTENYQHSIRYELEGTRLNCIYFLKDFKRKIFYYFSETCSDSLIDATRSREYSFNKKEVELFKKRYARDNKDAEGKNAYEYFKQFSVLKAIPINQDMNEWLKEIALQLSNDNQQQSSEYRKNRIADLEKYINENNIPIPEDTEKWLISLMNMLEAPIKITIQNNADINNGPGRIIHLFETIKKRIAVIFVFIKTAYQKFKILIKGMY